MKFVSIVYSVSVSCKVFGISKLFYCIIVIANCQHSSEHAYFKDPSHVGELSHNLLCQWLSFDMSYYCDVAKNITCGRSSGEWVN